MTRTYGTNGYQQVLPSLAHNIGPGPIDGAISNMPQGLMIPDTGPHHIIVGAPALTKEGVANLISKPEENWDRWPLTMDRHDGRPYVRQERHGIPENMAKPTDPGLRITDPDTYNTGQIYKEVTESGRTLYYRPSMITGYMTYMGKGGVGPSGDPPSPVSQKQYRALDRSDAWVPKTQTGHVDSGLVQYSTPSIVEGNMYPLPPMRTARIY